VQRGLICLLRPAIQKSPHRVNYFTLIQGFRHHNTILRVIGAAVKAPRGLSDAALLQEVGRLLRQKNAVVLGLAKHAPLPRRWLL
jgi:hypothetical protein